MAKYTEAKRDANRRWDSNNMDRISITVPKGIREQIKAAADQAGTSMNVYIREAIYDRIEQESGTRPKG